MNEIKSNKIDFTLYRSYVYRFMTPKTIIYDHLLPALEDFTLICAVLMVGFEPTLSPVEPRAAITPHQSISKKN